MFENLSSKIERAFKVLKGQGQITEINVAETLKEVRRALLDADVNFSTAKDFTNKVKEKALGRDVLKAVSPGQLMIKICHEELIALMGGNEVEINTKGTPGIILMSGLQGSGKTTFTGKLGAYLKNKKGKRVLLVACDVYRPAAIDQLHVLGEQLSIEVFSNREEKNPVQIARNAVQHARSNNFHVVIIDTAGRLAVDEAMMQEIAEVKKAIQPTETLFVVDSMTSIKSVVNKPIKFVGTGEKMDAIDVFYPARMADRILGMGDVVSLVEKAQEQFDEEQARKLQRKIMKDQFDFNDFLAQLEQIKKMGNVKDLMGMIPGMSKAMKDTEVPDDAFKGVEAIIRSMTPKERSTPALLNASRKTRIAKGSGTTVADVNKLIKQFEEMRKMMKMMSNPRAMAGLMGQMKNMR
ncbi:MAG: signal recognition particle protein Srp54 [Flavobacteriia bacterium]|nr:signal recognition particle protein Srp54 [Flavobacteriia bacterium]